MIYVDNIEITVFGICSVKRSIFLQFQPVWFCCVKCDCYKVKKSVWGSCVFSVGQLWSGKFRARCLVFFEAVSTLWVCMFYMFIC